MRVLILGGTTGQSGGVEAFVRRATSAFETNGYTVRHLQTETAFLRPATLRRLLSALMAYVTTSSRSYDVAWLQYGNFFDLTYLAAARLTGRRLYVTPHVGTALRSQSSTFMRSAAKGLLGLAKGILTLSPTQEQELALPSSVPIARIATFLPQFGPLRETWSDLARSPLVLLHAGRLSADKGTFRFLDTLRELGRRGIAFDARIAGGPEEGVEARLRSELEAEDLRGRVRYLGVLDQASLMQQLAECDALVHLSISDSYPLILLEAIGSGAVPIAIDLPGARSIVDGFSGHAVPQSGAAVAAAEILARAQQDPRFLPESRLSAAEKVRGAFGWPSCVARVTEAFRLQAR